MIDIWTRDGTLARITDAVDQRTPVKIKRSSGEWQTGIILTTGHGGLVCLVAWGDIAALPRNIDGMAVLPAGVLGKTVRTENVILWNRWLAGEMAS